MLSLLADAPTAPSQTTMALSNSDGGDESEASVDGEAGLIRLYRAALEAEVAFRPGGESPKPRRAEGGVSWTAVDYLAIRYSFTCSP